MKLWVSPDKKPTKEGYVYCDSLLSALEKIQEWHTHAAGASLIAGKNAYEQTITEIYCEEDYVKSLFVYFARTYVLSPMPKIRVIE